MTEMQYGPARVLVKNAYMCGVYGGTGMEGIEREADAHDATFAALVEAAEAIDRLNDDWDFSSMLDEPVEFAFISRDLFGQLRAALKAAKEEI